MWRWWIAVTGSIAAVAFVSHAHAGPLIERPGHVTEAEMIIEAPPAEVYRLVTDYERWPAVLTDVVDVQLVRGGARDGRVRFGSRAFGREVTVLFDNVPDKLIRFRGVKGPPGGRARGEYRLTPVPGSGGTRTHVLARLYLDVVGLPGLFVRDSTIRAMRRHKLDRDLTDVARWFALRNPPK
ncbi:MAG: SRPBCC family protein [Kofleriaceae bacterium]